jgi:hypothetical protein
MTPEEKASELYDKFYALYPDQDAQWIAQEAATIAVNEIIAAIPTQPSKTETERIDAIMFWIEVKQELSNI